MTENPVNLALYSGVEKLTEQIFLLIRRLEALYRIYQPIFRSGLDKGLLKAYFCTPNPEQGASRIVLRVVAGEGELSASPAEYKK